MDDETVVSKEDQLELQKKLQEMKVKYVKYPDFIEARIADSEPDAVRDRFTKRSLREAARNFEIPVPAFYGTESGVYPFGKIVRLWIRERKGVVQLIATIKGKADAINLAIYQKLRPYPQFVLPKTDKFVRRRKDIREIMYLQLQAVGVAKKEHVDNNRNRLFRPKTIKEEQLCL